MRNIFFPKIKTFFVLALATLFSHVAHAQEPVEMAEKLREDGKIYVVVLVLAVIFAGIIGYLVYLDRKITKLEKQHNQ